MLKIKGNATGAIVVSQTGSKNEYGEREHKTTEIVVKGYLDMSGSDARRNIYDAKVEESTHIFICNYSEDIAGLRGKEEMCSFKFKGLDYDLLYIDNVMELNEHMELYLKRAGGVVVKG